MVPRHTDSEVHKWYSLAEFLKMTDQHSARGCVSVSALGTERKGALEVAGAKPPNTANSRPDFIWKR